MTFNYLEATTEISWQPWQARLLHFYIDEAVVVRISPTGAAEARAATEVTHADATSQAEALRNPRSIEMRAEHSFGQ
jgi:hypothetical protein